MIKDMFYVLLGAGVVIAIVWGWIANIVEIFGMDFDPITGELVLRVAGIFVAPLGVVMGYI